MEISSSAQGVARTTIALSDLISVVEAAGLIRNPVIIKATPAPPRETSMVWSNQVMRCSPFIQTKTKAERPIWILEKETAQEAIFVLGDAKPAGIERYFTLKGDKKNGRLYRLERNTSGDEFWQPLD